MNHSMGSGIIRYIRASKTFSKFRALRSFVRFEVPCASKFHVLRSSVRFEVPCASKFRAVTIYVTHSPPNWPLEFRRVSALQRLHLSRSVFHAMFARNDSKDKHFYYKYRFIRIMKQNINCNEH